MTAAQFAFSSCTRGRGVAGECAFLYVERGENAAGAASGVGVFGRTLLTAQWECAFCGHLLVGFCAFVFDENLVVEKEVKVNERRYAYTATSFLYAR